MISATLDTNVLAAGFVRPEPPPGQLLLALNAGLYTLLISEHILRELARTFTKPYFASRIPPQQQADNLAFLRQRALLLSRIAEVQGVATHPEDDLVLATAVSGQANYLVTGDGAFRRQVPEYRGVKLVSPREFLDLLQEEAARS